MVLGLVFALAGLVALTVGADHFVRGAARLAIIYRVSPVVVGAVIIGFGTSAPEMVVSGIAAAQDDLDVGVGNVIGSNVANISLVLAAATLITVVPVTSRVLRREAPLSVGSCILFAYVVRDGIERWEGALLFVVLVLVLGWILRSAREGDALADEVEEFVDDAVEIEPDREAVRTAVGLVAVVAASWFLVDGAIRVAESLDLTGGFVGFTLVALGTSAPELITAVAAARQGETEILVGNLLGSNMFNSLAVGGVIGLVGPGPVLDTTLAEVGSLLMIGIVVLSWIMMITKRGVQRWEGAVLIALWLLSVILLAGGEEAAGAVVSLR